MVDKDFVSELKAVKAVMEDLSSRVEGWRSHTGTTGTFISDALKTISDTLLRMEDRLNV